MKNQAVDRANSFAEPEDFFNEITRDFIIQEDKTSVAIRQNEIIKVQIPDPSQIHVDFKKIPDPIEAGLISEQSGLKPVLPPLDQWQEKSQSQISLGPDKSLGRNPFALDIDFAFAFKNYLLPAILLCFLAGGIFIFLNRSPRSTNSSEELVQQDQQTRQDQWRMQVTRPLIELKPVYHDWTDVENSYDEMTDSEK